MSADGILSVVVGDGFSSNGDENVPATSTSLNAPAGLYLDNYNHLSFCEYGGNRLRMVSLATSLVKTVAGNGGYSSITASNGDGGLASAATMTYPLGVYGNFDSSILYVADTGDNRIRTISLVTAPTGIPSYAPTAPPTELYVKSLGGTGSSGYTKSGPFTSALIKNPTYVWADTTGQVLFSDSGNHVIRSFNESSDYLKTVAGKGYAGDGTSYYATSSPLHTPMGIWGATNGNIYFCDSGNGKVRYMSWNSYYGRYSLYTYSSGLGRPVGIWGDSMGLIYVTDANSHEVKLLQSYASTVLVGTNSSGYVDNCIGTAASLHSPAGIWGNTNGMLFIADSGNSVVRQYSISSGIVSTLLSNNAFETPEGVFLDQYGYLVITDTGANSIWYVNPDQTSASLSLIGGSTSGTSGFVDNVLGTHGLLNGPVGVFGDSLGDYYFADSSNNRVRKLFCSVNPIPTPAPTLSLAPSAAPSYSDQISYYIESVVGSGVAGFKGDYGLANNSRIHSPTSVWCDTNGGMFISDTLNHRVRYVSSSGKMYSVAGSGVAGSGVAGYSTSTYGTQAQLNFPAGIFGDTSGNVFVADYKNNRIRKLYVQYQNYYYGSINSYYVSVYANVTLPYGIVVGQSEECVLQ